MENKPMIKVEYPQEVIDFIQMNGDMIVIDGIPYYRPPQFWYSQAYLGSTTVLSVYNKLPPSKQQDK